MEDSLFCSAHVGSGWSSPLITDVLSFIFSDLLGHRALCAVRLTCRCWVNMAALRHIRCRWSNSQHFPSNLEKLLSQASQIRLEAVEQDKIPHLLRAGLFSTTTNLTNLVLDRLSLNSLEALHTNGRPIPTLKRVCFHKVSRFGTLLSTFRQHTSLQELQFVGKEFSSTDGPELFNLIQSLPSLEKLLIRASEPHGDTKVFLYDALQAIASNTRVSSLRIEVDLVDLAMDPHLGDVVSRCTSLTSLHFSALNWSNAALVRATGELPTLKHLTIMGQMGSHIEEIFPNNGRAYSCLETLETYKPEVNPFPVLNLKSFPSLRRLIINGYGRDFAISFPLATFIERNSRELEILSIEGVSNPLYPVFRSLISCQNVITTFRLAYWSNVVEDDSALGPMYDWLQSPQCCVSSLELLDLDVTPFDWQGIVKVATSLKTLRKLVITTYDRTRAPASVAKAIAASPSIQVLQVPVDTDSAPSLKSLLQQSTSLVELDLTGSVFRDEDLAEVISALAANTYLRSFKLDNHRGTRDRSCQALAEILPQNSALRQLSLRGTTATSMMNQESLISLIEKIEENQSLEVVVLPDCGTGRFRADALRLMESVGRFKLCALEGKEEEDKAEWEFRH